MYTVLTCGIVTDESGATKWGLVPTDEWRSDPKQLEAKYNLAYCGWIDAGKPRGCCPRIVRDDANYRAYKARQYAQHEALVTRILNDVAKNGHSAMTANGFVRNNVVYGATML